MQGGWSPHVLPEGNQAFFVGVRAVIVFLGVSRGMMKKSTLSLKVISSFIQVHSAQGKYRSCCHGHSD